VIADIRPEQVHTLVQALQNDYYVDEQAWQAAIRQGHLSNVIHLNTMRKPDLIPLKQRAFTREEARRAQPHLLEAGTRPVRIASAEDAALTKLEWFDMGGRSSASQWNDILGIMGRQGASLDLAYLHHWADALHVRDRTFTCPQRGRPHGALIAHGLCMLESIPGLFFCSSLGREGCEPFHASHLGVVSENETAKGSSLPQVSSAEHSALISRSLG
jgi:hypothetical protein